MEKVRDQLKVQQERAVLVGVILKRKHKTNSDDVLGELTAQPAPEMKTRQLIENATLAMLDCDSELHREYSAEVLGSIGSHDAIEPLVRALERSRACGTPGEWSEPWAIRAALRRLGYKTRYESDGLQGSRVDENILFDAWYVDASLRVLDELLRNQQLVVGIQTWTMSDDGVPHWSSNNKRWHWEADYSKPFELLVVASHHYASGHLQAMPNPRRTLVTMDWFGKGDLHSIPRTP